MRIPHALLLLLALPLAIPAAGARTLFVDQNAPGPDHDGASWKTAFLYIGQAVDAAQAGDEVWVGPGIYRGRVMMKPGVGLYGGFVGIETLRDERPGLPGLTVLSQADYAVSVPPGAFPDTVIDGFTFQSQAFLCSTGTSSGGIYVQAASPTITHNRFIGLNTPQRDAGCAIFVPAAGAPIIESNVFAGCGAPSGALVYSSNADVILRNNTFAGNSAVQGVLVCRGGNPTIENTIVAHNMAGLAFTNATPILRGNCFWANTLFDVNGAAYTPGADGNLATDPKLASLAYGNVHIQPDSPCVDAGIGDIPPDATDIDLLPRVMGARVDIGADESDGRIWTVRPRIVYVRPDGSDTNNGSSWAQAKQTIHAAVALVEGNGGEVWVATGQYGLIYQGPSFVVKCLPLPAFVHLYGGFKGSETDRAARDWVVNPTTLDATYGAGSVIAVAGHRVSTLDGFLLEQTMGTISGAVTCVGAGPVVANNVITTTKGSAVYAVGSAPLLDNNAVVGITAVSPAALIFQNAAPEILANYFSGNGVSGSAPVVSLASCPAALVRNNLFEGNYFDLIRLQGSRAEVTNNTFVNNQGVPLAMASPIAVVFANNIVAFGSQPLPYQSASTVKVEYNAFYGTGYKEGYPPYGTGNIAAYPVFADIFQGDYRLSAASPCLDAGNDAYVRPGELDLAGLPRLQGRHVDMGAYESEWTSSAPRRLDLPAALRIAGGLSPSTPADAPALDGNGGITLADVLALAHLLRSR